jgi:hypothetical protein
VSRDRLDPATGEFVHSSRQSSTGAGLNDIVRPERHRQLQPQRHRHAHGQRKLQRPHQRPARQRPLHQRRHIDAGGSEYLRTTERSGDSKNYSWGGRYDHKGALPGETLKIDLRVSASENDATATTPTTTSRPASPIPWPGNTATATPASSISPATTSVRWPAAA